MSKLLFDEQPIVVDRTLAKLIGLNEAIVLQQVHYWITINQKAKKNFHEGRYWTYNSIKAWHEENFEFWSYDTVKRTFSKLESLNLLITDNFNKDPRDKTKWYSINYEVLETLKNTISAKCEVEKTLKFPIGAKCTNAKGQNAPMQKGKMHQALPETSTEITSEISKISQSVSQEKKKQKKEKQPIRTTTDRQTEFENIKLYFKDKLYLDDLKISHKFDTKLIEEIELNILEMYFNDYTTIKGERKPREIVRSALMKLDNWHIEELISKYKGLTIKITNPKAYMQTMIYNIAFENDLSVTNAVQHDMSIGY